MRFHIVMVVKYLPTLTMNHSSSTRRCCHAASYSQEPKNLIAIDTCNTQIPPRSTHQTFYMCGGYGKCMREPGGGVWDDHVLIRQSGPPALSR